MNYRAWKDKQGNIAIQCSVCGRIHWGVINIYFDPPCENCQDLLDDDVLNTEQANHNAEEGECTHRSTQ